MCQCNTNCWKHNIKSSNVCGFQLTALICQCISLIQIKHTYLKKTCRLLVTRPIWKLLWRLKPCRAITWISLPCNITILPVFSSDAQIGTKYVLVNSVLHYSVSTIAMQLCAIQYCGVQCNTVMCFTILWCAVQYSYVLYNTVVCSAIQLCAIQYCGVQCNTVMC